MAVVAISTGGYLIARANDGETALEDRGAAPKACVDTPREVLQRVRRGYYPKRSGDVVAIERLPNQFTTRHSTPWPYTQDIPMVLYGPGYIRDGFSSDADVTLADLAPTFAELLGFDEFGERDGRSLNEALLPPDQRNGDPRLIVTVVWDGGGDNMLEQWPDSWPYLKSLVGKSASFDNATVGSSPSITPSAHATLGSGDFPRTHGLPDTRVRVGGKMVDAWEDKSPRKFEVDTLGDAWDLANGNTPLVGLVARDNWHLGMIGHGSFLNGADKDIAVLDALGKLEFTTSPKHFTLPEYSTSLDGLAAAVEQVDLRDGRADGQWLGNDLTMDGKIRETPAWSIFQTQKVFEVLGNEGFGADEVPDLFFTNYKPTDLAGHTWNMVEPEVRDNLEEQDRQLELIVKGLNELVGNENYVLALTADHGMTPYPEETGGWSIVMTELTKDLEREFNTEMPDTPLLLSNRGYQFFLDRDVMEANDVTAEEIAAYIRNYRLGDNVARLEDVPERFKDRVNERLYLTAMSAAELDTPACKLD